MTVTEMSQSESRCDTAVSHGCPDPTRPDPSLQVVSGARVTPSIEPAVGPSPTPMDDRSAAHIHRFRPVPDGLLFGKTRYRNRCACGHWQTPRPPRRLERGPACRRCGFPTVGAIADPADPVHPCCAEPQIMAIGLAAARRRKGRR